MADGNGNGTTVAASNGQRGVAPIQAQVVGQSAQQGHGHVRVGVDQAGHQHFSAAVDGLGGRVFL